MSTPPLRLYLTTTTAAPVAADVTLLLAASSFIEPAEQRIDPRCDDAFDAVTTAYCNGAELYVPLPKADVDAVPFFFSLWSESSSLNTVPHLELTDKAFSQHIETLGPHLATFIEGDAWDVARWAAYQFTQDIVAAHVRRSDMDAIQRAGESAGELIRLNELTELRNAVGELQKSDTIYAPEEYRPLVGTREIPSFFHLVVAYTLSVSVRGCAYAYGLAQIPSSPIYRHHWIRSPALRYGFPDATAKLDAQPSEWVPWGTILRKVFAPGPTALLKTHELERVLTELRNRTPRLREELTRTDERLNKKGLSQDEEILIETMLDVGIVPRYADTARAEQLATWLRELVSAYAPVMKLPIQIVTSTLQPTMLRRLEVNLRRTFRRDTFWQVLEDSGVRAAMRKY